MAGFGGARRSPCCGSWRCFCFTALVLVRFRVVDGEAVDQEYQTWAAKVYDAKDDEATSKGSMIACVFCNIITGATEKQTKLNKQRQREDRFSEEMIEEVLLNLCSATAPRIARAMKGYKKDAEMICRRVVKEQLSDMLDAASLGEDIMSFCKDNNICPMDANQFQSMVEIATKAMAEANKETQQKTAEL